VGILLDILNVVNIFSFHRKHVIWSRVFSSKTITKLGADQKSRV